MGLFKKKKTNRYSNSDVNDDGSIDEYTADSVLDDTYQVDIDQDDTFDDDGQPRQSSKKKKKKSSFDPSILLVIVGAIVVIGLLYVGVSSIWGPRTGQCKEVISELQGGINELNPDRFINVLEPKTKRVIQIIFVTLESTTDIDLSNAFSDALNSICRGMIPSDTGEPVTDLLKKIEIVPVNYGMPGFTRSVKCKVQFDGVTYKYIRIKLKKYEGETYIKGITLLEK